VDTVRRVVVVGAGLAGLAAARALTDAGWDATVVEARERAGGRIWTVRLDNDEIAELGAEWVMPGDTELRSWADRFGVAMAEAGVDYLRREARGPGASSQGEQDEFLAAANAALAAIPPDGSPGLTLGTFLDALDARAGQLIPDAFPCSTVELLPEWEATLGLPDPCVQPPLTTLQQRQAAVCAKLVARGVPFFFSTGYSEHGLMDGYRNQPVLNKPFHCEKLVEMLTSLLLPRE
jgi:uncharacterized protein YmfQ (DUF2313 family)